MAGTTRIPPIAWRVEGGAWRVEGRTGGIFRLCRFSRDEVGSEGAPMASFARFRRFGADELASFVRFLPLLTRAIDCHSGRWLRLIAFGCAGRALWTRRPARDGALVHVCSLRRLHVQRREEENSSLQRSHDERGYGIMVSRNHRCFHDRWRALHSAAIPGTRCRLGPDRPMKFRRPICQRFRGAHSSIVDDDTSF